MGSGLAYNFNIILAIFKKIKENPTGEGIEVSNQLYASASDLQKANLNIPPQQSMEDTIKDWKTKTFNLF